MLSIELVCIGKVDAMFQNACAEYQKRIGAYANITVTELSETKLAEDSDAARRKVIETESDRILAHIQKKRGLLAALCIEGKPMDSVSFSGYLRNAAQTDSRIHFVVGGSLGLSDKLKQQAALKLSMSAMTFPHQRARLMLLEQLYRAMSIQTGSSYHK